MLGEQRARKRGEQRVGVFVKAVCRERLGEIFVGVFVAHIKSLGSDGAACERLVLDGFEVGFVLPNVSADGDNIEVLFNLQPLYAARSIQAAGIREYYLLFFSHWYAFLHPPPPRRPFHLIVRAIRPHCANPEISLRQAARATKNPAKPGVVMRPYGLRQMKELPCKDSRQHTRSSQRVSSVLASERSVGGVEHRKLLSSVVSCKR